jgi:toxin ParE1/3/4
MSSRKKSSPKAAVILTERALADIRNIESYSLEEWGRKTAEKYLDDMATALDRLKANPQILQLEPAFATGLFFYRVRKHFLVCDFDGRTVIVLTVIHTSMDIPTRLAELQPRLIAEAQFLHNKLRNQTTT